MVLEFLKYKPQHNKINLSFKILIFLQMMYRINSKNIH